ncbi:uncharacterized protein [Ambystoma mexicanum]|uniref:uncharacterized protein isoform X2 n=1 Tax=Ambystoma mexicanum TaxID=8296 RepID=UPI0037E905B5
MELISWSHSPDRESTLILHINRTHVLWVPLFGDSLRRDVLESPVLASRSRASPARPPPPTADQSPKNAYAEEGSCGYRLYEYPAARLSRVHPQGEAQKLWIYRERRLLEEHGTGIRIIKMDKRSRTSDRTINSQDNRTG